jgi:thiol-disulfide isomerase/thioredoxin
MVFSLNLPQIEGTPWFNSEPLTNKDFEGKVVLLDFFTYSCVNCLRSLKHLRELHKKYSSLGLVIIGIHTPEFEFEKSSANVEKALKDLKIKWPVVIDNDLNLWHLFANKYWPSKYLSNKDGKIVFSHVGEGKYLETENEIRTLLELDPIEPEKFKLEDYKTNRRCMIYLQA